MPTSYNFVDAQRSLIKPFERIGFVIIFVLITGLSQVVAYFVFLQPPFDLLWERSQMQYGIVTGIIAGILTGTCQWLILRKYVSDWKWILVAGVSSAFIETIQTAINMWRESLFSSGDGSRLFEQGIAPIVLVAVIFCIFLIGVGFIFGYLQWYVLRPYVTNARWWIFIPLIAGVAGSVLLLPSFLTRGLVGFNRDVISLTILPTTQAIGFCILRKKSLSEFTIPQSPLALAPDIVNYWAIQKLGKKLHTRISRIWTTDLTTSIGQLSYLVGVSRNGDIVCHEPVNQNSTDNIDQTPLPELAGNPSSVALGTEDLTSFAKFQVVFTPPSIVQIHSWRGIPLIWLAVTSYTGIMGISFLCALLKVNLFPLENNLQ